jgi:hypothetical protein
MTTATVSRRQRFKLRLQKTVLRDLKRRGANLIRKLTQPTPASTNTLFFTVDELMRNIDTLNDAQCLQAVENLLHYNPSLMNHEAMKAFLQEWEAAGAVIDLPPALPANINPATLHPGAQMRDWNGRRVTIQGNLLDGPDPRVIVAAPDVVPEQPSAFGANWGRQKVEHE